MSFAGDVKNELCRATLSRRCCVQAEAYGVLLFCNLFSGGEVRIMTENDGFAARLPQLFRRAFGVGFDVEPEPGEHSGKLTFSISNAGKIERIFNFKYPTEYIDRFAEILDRKRRVEDFYEHYAAQKAGQP